MTLRLYLGTLVALFGSCAPAPLVPPCSIAQPNLPLSRDIVESSGLALSRRTPGVLWTHNDSGHEPYLYAVDSTGATLGRVRVTGATLIDWEDMASGPCDAGNCLFIGDIGDNSGRRDSISIYVVPEPAPTDTATAPATVLTLRYPDHPRDAEAMFVLPNGDLYLVSKGRRDSVALFRISKAAQQPVTLTTLERVRALWPRPRDGDDRVTGASASPDGRRIAIRTYRTLVVFATADLLGQGLPLEPSTRGRSINGSGSRSRSMTAAHVAQQRGERLPPTRAGANRLCSSGTVTNVPK
jgi:hypothetical protein